MTTEALNPLVRAAIEAMNARNRQAWFSLFADDTVLTDDGSVRDFIQWSDSEFFGKTKAYLMSVDRVEDDGMTIYGRFHSDQWGEFDTFMKFKIQGDKIRRLDVGQVDA
ncbi:MAG: hypothetical protein KF716_29130 [Anaerolineae bacterium]|nr:hypothetical protein [Anaerolineae bacterium]